MKHFEKYIGIFLVIFAIGVNLWIYRSELTAKLDPNDNTFQYALVHRTNEMWDYAVQTKNPSLLFDHWVPNWAQGYNLPYYYSHIPQIAIVASWRMLHIGSLFQYYHIILYLLLCFFPLSLFLALRVIGLSWLASGIGALVASHLSTDGLYGLDPSSFLWRGFGLSSQLFAMIWLPLALAYAYRGKVIPAILFLAATTAGHLGIGIIAFMSITIAGLKHIKKLPFIYGGVFLLLGYWIFPIFLHGNYHNTSVWDPIWKFDSYGYREVLKNLFNGDLFDFGRYPILTLFVFIGMFVSLLSIEYWSLGILCIFWLLAYFGRTTWGGLIDLIPGMTEFHLSRFLVGLQITGLFLIPIGIESIFLKIPKKSLVVFAYLCIGVLVYFSVFPQTFRYAKYNDFLISRANTEFTKISQDTDTLLSTLSSLLSKNPGRVYFGRGGNWGKDFKIAETSLFLYASTFGIPTILWLPETWSPNSDTEQYFSDNRQDDYTLYNVRYVATPANLPSTQIQPFWKLIDTGKTWKLYEVDGLAPRSLGEVGYISAGIHPAIVSIDKTNFTNLVHLWMISDFPKSGLYPELTFDKGYPKNTGLPNFKMIDEANYRIPDGSLHNLFSENPSYLGNLSALSNLTILSQSSDHDMIFRATIDVPKNCSECIVILRQTFHPSWTATIDGKKVDTLTVFPFYTAISIPEGKHEVVFSYQMSPLKQLLFFIGALSLVVRIIWCFVSRKD